ncbi:MAG: NAD(P)/FAD-dependent oxidoreductase [Archangium sp.]
MLRLDVAVVGTGTVGSATALFLARQGHRVTLYERVENPLTVGAGIMLQPTGMAVLRQLGLEQQVVSQGDRVDRLWVQTATGRKIMELEYEQLQHGMFGVGLHRGVLFKALYEAAKKEPGVEVRTGIDVEDLHTFPDGRQACVERESRKLHGKHDLIVVANGARSSLRDDTAFVKSVERYAWGALWAIVPDHDNRYTGRLFQVVRGTQRLIGLLPTGHGPEGGPRQVSFFYSLRGDQLDAFPSCDFEQWKAEVLADVPESAPVLAQLKDHSALLYSHYHDIVMWPWNTERVVYLGDAAHAMSPQLGQGCNLALLDAWVFSQALIGAPSVPDALYAYSRTRRWHLSWYQFITRALTPFFQSDLTWLGPLRDYGMSQVVKIAWVRKQMVAAMAGVSRGPFMDLLKLP